MGMVQENKKKDIIESAISIFAEKGFDQPTMEYIASKASVSKRTLYKHFSCKNDLLKEIIPYFINKTNNSLETKHLRNKQPREQLIEVVKQKLSIILETDNIKLVRILVGEMLKENNSISSTLNNVYNNESFIHDCIQELQKSNILRKDKSVVDLVMKLNDLVHGIVLFPFLLRGRAPQTEDAEVIVELYLRYSAVE
ncbi:MAG: TetR/AcrR family transcriptional regulator of autoinduction and epiphytic fitness [Bacteriovoracaceae bacterium]